MTIISLNIISMYPSIFFRMVKKAVKYYAKKLNRNQKRVIKDSLEIIKLGMGYTIITFIDKYDEYRGFETF